ncbi:MAG: bifunctional phosphopantothenoylcysteine decarboxylase/phosphopantothenate--cysteine ligase CoaBC [Candidatus Devosia phytovorans]|uniref:Coenzyme A biosynthesis bifunctional protein CoaBC n=1 Tax=Candidatus Devosia phytovorans TaxID=3121372 RepID=A0AAJ6B1R4_9HYPH|nr:bifunctional phosphopantothenoylcysteine decarboxylase/phosphopantothenate--cysteine ligase CoaBC [Devosia sp.]WEK06562.1 MAG: bifunctional phosphopantothenoylcysteine decarboxylase/phosphopantothenate--cysteine ligase CoaBC [Devosia sp.]
MSLRDKQILLIVSGGIAAYKTPDLVRRLREQGARVRCVMTDAARNFITPTSLAAVSGTPVATDLFEPIAGADVGHIRIAREADLIIVAPATADFMARMALGLSNDLATSILLARSGPVLIAPAMNPKMWDHAATQRNAATLKADGVLFVGPETGEMAESGEAGLGRMAEPMTIVEAARLALGSKSQRLAGLSFFVTSGPTEEPIDPVRFISNRSSGKQGHAIAAALAREGASVTLISGPSALPPPQDVAVVAVQTAAEMMEAATTALPVDGAVFVAAVADWRAATVATSKLKKQGGDDEQLSISLVRNPDILATIGHHEQRPRLVVGFAAETDALIDNAQAKLRSKGADWILANDVSTAGGVFGGDHNHVHLVAGDGVTDLGAGTKQDIAERIIARIAGFFDRA